MGRYFQNQSATLGKRDRTRSALIDATIEIVGESGAENPSIKEITTNAGMTSGTFYNHFRSREHAVAEAVAAIVNEIAIEILELVKDVEDGLERIVLSTDIMMCRLVDQPNWGRLIAATLPYMAQVEVDFSAGLRQELMLAKEQGQISIPVNWLLEAQLIQVIAIGISEQLQSGSSAETRSQTCQAVLRILGKTPKQAEKHVNKTLRI